MFGKKYYIKMKWRYMWENLGIIVNSDESLSIRYLNENLPVKKLNFGRTYGLNIQLKYKVFNPGI